MILFVFLIIVNQEIMKSHYHKKMSDSFKKNLRDELNYQDLTVKELSAKIDIPKPTLDCYLGSRQTMPPADIAVKIAKALNVSVEYLVTGKDEKIIPQNYEELQPFRYLLDDLKQLDEKELEFLSVMIHVLARRKK